ncbi:MAG: CapA family protein [Bdellovibrionales bacterium]|nr:CapA family protein [Bdellovibrionales bacterium]
MSFGSNIRILLYGGDTMLARAVQLILPVQAPGEEFIKDKWPAWSYLFRSLEWEVTWSDLHGQPHYSPEMLHEIEQYRKENESGTRLWGDTLSFQMEHPPDLRILNLETAVTRTIDSRDQPRKLLRYHLHVDNIGPVFNRFSEQRYGGNQVVPYIVSLANNHSMDFGRKAFHLESLPMLNALPGDGTLIGAGRNFRQASAPFTRTINGVPIQVYAFTTLCAGTWRRWSATSYRSGVSTLPALTSQRRIAKALRQVSSCMVRHRNPNAIRILSIHWGPNWATENDHQDLRQIFAHRLIDELGFDLIYGHSTHHIRGLERYKGKLIVYGAGDLINDYESYIATTLPRYNHDGGIFVVDLDRISGILNDLRVLPLQIKKLQLRTLEAERAAQLASAINDHSCSDCVIRSPHARPLLLSQEQYHAKLDVPSEGVHSVLRMNRED